MANEDDYITRKEKKSDKSNLELPEDKICQSVRIPILTTDYFDYFGQWFNLFI